LLKYYYYYYYFYYYYHDKSSLQLFIINPFQDVLLYLMSRKLSNTKQQPQPQYGHQERLTY